MENNGPLNEDQNSTISASFSGRLFSEPAGPVSRGIVIAALVATVVASLLSLWVTYSEIRRCEANGEKHVANGYCAAPSGTVIKR